MTLTVQPLPANVSSFTNFIQWTSTVTEGWFGPLTLLSIFAFFFLQFGYDRPERSLLIASLITLMPTLYFWSIGAALNTVLFINFGLILLGVILVISKE